MRAIYDKVIIEIQEASNKTEDGILIPETSIEKPSIGTVLSAGNGTLNPETLDFFPLQVKEGDKVMFIKNRGVDVKFNGKDCIIIKEENILCIL